MVDEESNHPMIVSIVFGSYEVAGENGLADFGKV